MRYNNAAVESESSEEDVCYNNAAVESESSEEDVCYNNAAVESESSEEDELTCPETTLCRTEFTRESKAASCLSSRSRRLDQSNAAKRKKVEFNY